MNIGFVGFDPCVLALQNLNTFINTFNTFCVIDSCVTWVK